MKKQGREREGRVGMEIVACRVEQEEMMTEELVFVFQFEKIKGRWAVFLLQSQAIQITLRYLSVFRPFGLGTLFIKNKNVRN
jgi:hypothetical protein